MEIFHLQQTLPSQKVTVSELFRTFCVKSCVGEHNTMTVSQVDQIFGEAFTCLYDPGLLRGVGVPPLDIMLQILHIVATRRWRV